MKKLLIILTVLFFFGCQKETIELNPFDKYPYVEPVELENHIFLISYGVYDFGEPACVLNYKTSTIQKVKFHPEFSGLFNEGDTIK